MTSSNGHHVLEPHGPQAARIAELFTFNVWTVGVVYVLVTSCLLIAVGRRRKSKDGSAATPELGDLGDHEEHELREPVRRLSEAKERSLTRSVLICAGLTIATLVFLLGYSVHAGKALDALSRKGLMRIEIVGRQWWWRVTYLDEKPAGRFTTANEIHIPVGTPVEFELTSSDVIHSFWVPALHGKRDLIPGRRTSLLLQADEVGSYRGQCAEFCGHGHALMGLWIIVESREDFEAWRAHQLSVPPAPTEALAQRGARVFLGGPCVMCHSVNGTSAQSNAGPDLTHFKSRRSLAADTLRNTRGHLAGWIANSQGIKPGNHMPSIGLAPADLHAVLAYLETLR